MQIVVHMIEFQNMMTRFDQYSYKNCDSIDLCDKAIIPSSLLNYLEQIMMP
ncbi:MAG: hypothetical protein ACK4TO_00405 [Candidatus Nitrosotenuis sp.]